MNATATLLSADASAQRPRMNEAAAAVPAWEGKLREATERRAAALEAKERGDEGAEAAVIEAEKDCAYAALELDRAKALRAAIERRQVAEAIKAEEDTRADLAAMLGERLLALRDEHGAQLRHHLSAAAVTWQNIHTQTGALARLSGVAAAMGSAHEFPPRMVASVLFMFGGLIPGPRPLAPPRDPVERLVADLHADFTRAGLPMAPLPQKEISDNA